MHEKRQLYRCEQHRVIAGVCTGMSEYFSCDLDLLRVVFLLSVMFGGVGLLLYGVCWLCMPLAPVCSVNAFGDSSRRICRNFEQRRLAGVCAGIAEYVGIDPVWLRINFVLGALLFGYLIFI